MMMKTAACCTQKGWKLSGHIKAALISLYFVGGLSHAQEQNNGFGWWSGEVQYKESEKAQTNPKTHEVTPLKIRIENSGKAIGLGMENGCKLLGIGRPDQFSNRVIHLDVTLTDCKHEVYKGTFGGRIFVNGEKSASLELSRLVFLKGGGTKSLSLSGMVKR